MRWSEMKDRHPVDFAAAVEFEREMRAKDGAAWLRKSCVPLDQVDFTAQRGLFGSIPPPYHVEVHASPKPE